MGKVAVVGLGIMGRGMADNLLKHGHDVTVWNRTAGRADDLVEAGAVRAQSPAEAAAGADVVFEVTANDESSREVWLGPDGIVAAASPGTVLIASATLSVGWVEELAAECERRGLIFFDMPLTGGSAGAQTGNLVMLAGGDRSRLAALDPVLGSISREVKYFGPAGSGTRFKLVLNALQAVHLAAFGEALKLAAAAGLDPAQVGPALVDRPGGVITELAWKSFGARPEPINFSAEWALKDLSYAALMSEQVHHPILDGVLSIFTEAVEQGRGHEDWSTVNEQRAPGSPA
ncbi:NAD(P)-dependent oxidoreductase [Streptosporangium sp. NPDC000396]|uniref:NAD(P)-dependent oxidoreductase n=1 Tax=Streptosporangium sp. NPDC000396 TaxID=3366185 RepID=UPI0036B82902